MKQSVKTNKELARVDATRYNSTLVESLHNLGRALSDLGQYEEALIHDEESLKISRELVDRDLESYTPTLADSLLNVGSDLSNLARHEESLERNREAVDIRRRLATQDFAQYHLAETKRTLQPRAFGGSNSTHNWHPFPSRRMGAGHGLDGGL